jgi:diaminohydroxyphosphoribosylaminopyrimidine deaminase/5-amino-6-(5-phosphoribosylamino)uracil reductase
VGALLVRDGEIIGEGYHQVAGGHHGEVAAIENAYATGNGERIPGATLYCTLEPCCSGMPGKRTPPCTRRIIDEGISEVVIATLDPNPHVWGNGKAELEDAGVSVVLGELADTAVLVNEAYFHFIQSRTPFVHLKIAQTLDGRIATRTGDSEWVTGDQARREVHLLRAASDAVLVGRGTAEADDPSLTVRHVEGHQPLRVVLDSHLSLSADLRLFTDAGASRTTVIASREAVARRQENPEVDAHLIRLEERGVTVHAVGTDGAGRLDLSAVLSYLGERRITSVLVEGGSGLFTTFIRTGLWDKLSIYLSPKVLGSGLDAVGSLGIQRLEEAVRLEGRSWHRVGEDLRVTGYRSLEDSFGSLLTDAQPALARLSSEIDASPSELTTGRRGGEIEAAEETLSVLCGAGSR